METGTPVTANPQRSTVRLRVSFELDVDVEKFGRKYLGPFDPESRIKCLVADGVNYVDGLTGPHYLDVKLTMIA